MKTSRQTAKQHTNSYREEGRQNSQHKLFLGKANGQVWTELLPGMDVPPQHRLPLACRDMRGRQEIEVRVLGDMNPLKEASPLLTEQFVSRDLLCFKCWAKPTAARACMVWVLTPACWAHTEQISGLFCSGSEATGNHINILVVPRPS